MGFQHSLCVRCTNGVQTEDLDDFTIFLSGTMSPGVMNNVELGYQEDAEEIILIDPLEVFGYTETPSFPIISCTLHNAADCGGADFSNPNLKLGSSPWNIRASKTSTEGYLHQVCVQCSNGVSTQNLDNLQISQCAKMWPGEIDDLNISYQAGADDQQVSFDPAMFNTVEN